MKDFRVIEVEYFGGQEKRTQRIFDLINALKEGYNIISATPYGSSSVAYILEK